MEVGLNSTLLLLLLVRLTLAFLRHHSIVTHLSHNFPFFISWILLSFREELKATCPLDVRWQANGNAVAFIGSKNSCMSRERMRLEVMGI